MNPLALWHTYFLGATLWAVREDGVWLPGEDRPMRTKGEPRTVRRIAMRYGEAVMAEAGTREYMHLGRLLLATIAVESGGNPMARREEPGWLSDEETPHRVSVGLCQTLLTTAAQALGQEVTAEELEIPEVSIRAGSRYIQQQWAQTGGDPVLVAAAYNAGGLYGDRGPWGLRCYPLHTGEHITRFCRFYGDACSLKGWR